MDIAWQTSPIADRRRIQSDFGADLNSVMQLTLKVRWINYAGARVNCKIGKLLIFIEVKDWKRCEIKRK
ncbi:hypothetical protein VcTj87_08210 [Vibrio comitans]